MPPKRASEPAPPAELALAPGTLLGVGSPRPWRIVKKLGAGTFGAVFLAERVGGGGVFALKVALLHDRVASRGKGPSQSQAAGLLQKEYTAYTQWLRWHPHLPVLPPSPLGNDEQYKWLAVQALTTTLGARLETSSGGRAPWRTVATLALQLLDVLAHVHAKGWVYRDLNLDNVMLGGAQPSEGVNARPSSSSSSSSNGGGGAPVDVRVGGEKCYLIDFGVATRFRGMSAGGGGGSDTPIAGTPLFCATATSFGSQHHILSPRDDLQSLGYLLLRVCGGATALPWHSAVSAQDVMLSKHASTPAVLCAPLVPQDACVTMKAYLEVIATMSPADTIASCDAVCVGAGASGGSGASLYAPLRALFTPHAHPKGVLEWGTGSAAATVAAAASPPPPPAGAAQERGSVRVTQPAVASGGRVKTPAAAPSAAVEVSVAAGGRAGQSVRHGVRRSKVPRGAKASTAASAAAPPVASPASVEAPKRRRGGKERGRAAAEAAVVLAVEAADVDAEEEEDLNVEDGEEEEEEREDDAADTSGGGSVLAAMLKRMSTGAASVLSWLGGGGGGAGAAAVGEDEADEDAVVIVEEEEEEDVVVPTRRKRITSTPTRSTPPPTAAIGEISASKRLRRTAGDGVAATPQHGAGGGSQRRLGSAAPTALAPTPVASLPRRRGFRAAPPVAAE